MVEMTDQEIAELAAILVNEHGYAAGQVAEARLREHGPGSDGYCLWNRIAAEVARLLRSEDRAEISEYSS